MNTISEIGEHRAVSKNSRKGLGVYKHLDEPNVIAGYNRPSRRARGAYADRQHQHVNNDLLFMRGLESDPLFNQGSVY